MFQRYIIYLTITITLLLLPIVVAAQPETGINFTDILEDVIRNPRMLIVMGIQFMMGLGLGYYASKALKYILALIAILVLGTVLSVWSIGSSPESFLTELYINFRELIPYILTFLQLLGIMTIGPVTLGFIVGVLLAIRK